LGKAIQSGSLLEKVKGKALLSLPRASMSRLTVKSFPRTRNKPQKRILLVPFFLMFGGWAMTYVFILQFMGTIIAMTGALTSFLVGAVYADLWAAQRRTKQLIKQRQQDGDDSPEEDIDKPVIEDPFKETYDES
jgi:hypothetical protein